MCIGRKTRLKAGRRKAERERQHADACNQASDIWERARPASGDHRYLRDKGVNCYGIRSAADRLVNPDGGYGGDASLLGRTRWREVEGMVFVW